jgi:hypothetical protein
VVVQVFPPGDDVTVYPVTGAPPVLVGAVQLIDELASWFDVDFTAVGAPETADGTTAEELAEATEVPLAFDAVTANV